MQQKQKKLQFQFQQVTVKCKIYHHGRRHLFIKLN